MTTTRTPTEAEVIQGAIDRALGELHVALPGRVVSYDVDEQTAKVQPLVRLRLTADEEPITLPEIPRCPVRFLRSGGSFISLPVKAGHTGTLLIHSSSIDAWLGAGGIQDPEMLHRHHLSDAEFIPGLAPFSDSVDADPDHVVVGVPDGTQIRLGSRSAADQIAKKSGLQAIYDAISSATPTPNDGGAALKAAILSTLGATFAADHSTTKTRAE